MKQDNEKFEELLGSLPTAKPPASVRARILSRAPQTSARFIWKRSLAFALVLLALLALDFGLEQVQSARLNQLMGDGRRVISPMPEKSLMLALAQQKAMFTDLMGKDELR
jgi:hypothetical protein